MKKIDSIVATGTNKYDVGAWTQQKKVTLSQKRKYYTTQTFPKRTQFYSEIKK